VNPLRPYTAGRHASTPPRRSDPETRPPPLAAGEIEDGGAVLVDHAVRQSVHQLEHPFSTVFLDGKVRGFAVVQIGQDHVVPGGGETLGHVVQLRAFSGRVHQEKHDREGAPARRIGDERMHRPVAGQDLYVAFDQRHRLAS
jgi:hypothetical protein